MILNMIILKNSVFAREGRQKSIKKLLILYLKIIENIYFLLFFLVFLGGTVFVVRKWFPETLFWSLPVPFGCLFGAPWVTFFGFRSALGGIFPLYFPLSPPRGFRLCRRPRVMVPACAAELGWRSPCWGQIWLFFVIFLVFFFGNVLNAIFGPKRFNFKGIFA